MYPLKILRVFNYFNILITKIDENEHFYKKLRTFEIKY